MEARWGDIARARSYLQWHAPLSLVFVVLPFLFFLSCQFPWFSRILARSFFRLSRVEK